VGEKAWRRRRCNENQGREKRRGRKLFKRILQGNGILGFDVGYPYVNPYGTCCTTPNTGNTAANNVYEDPQFVSSGNYHLRSTSPCIGRGMFKSWMTTSIDADGKPSIINGTVDIGAYEYSEAPITQWFLHDQLYYFSPNQ